MRRLATILLAFGVAPVTGQEGALTQDLQRAELSTRNPQSASEGLRELARRAAELFRAGRLPEALEAYDSAAAEAFRSGASGRAFEYSLAAAELQRARGEWLDSAVRFRRAALGAVNDPRSASAHHAACEIYSSLMNQSKADHEFLAAYDSLLAEHIAAWPKAQTAGEARWRRIELMVPLGQSSRLLEVVRAIPPEDPRYERSRRMLVSAHARLLAEAEAGEQRESRLQEATSDLETLILGQRRRWPVSWTASQRAAALMLARARMARDESGAEYALSILRVALNGQPSPEAEWQARAAALLTIASLAAGDAAQAKRTGAVLSLDERLLATTAERVAATQPDGLPALADRLLASSRLLSQAGDSQPDASRAAALADAGRVDQALEAYAALIEQQPNNRELKAQYARLLAARGRTEDLRQSLAQWREIENRSPRHTGQWFEARIERLGLLRRMNRVEDARRLLELTTLIAPEPSDPRQREQLEELARQLE